MEAFPLFVIVTFIALVAVGVYLAARAARKRREALEQLAAQLGLSFLPDKDRELARRYAFLDKLAQGSNRYAFNVLRGRFEGHEVLAFDYHYETYSTDSKGRQQTHHHHFSFFMLLLPRTFPELTIVREGFFSKLAQALGYDDIDFESAEFSRTFCVRSKDKRVAYDICHPRFMEYLLANRDLTLEIEGDVLALAFSGQLAPDRIESNLRRLVALRELFPAYLLNPT
ncbi:MAG: DUF3137 domain-containing protein [Verrucomicrobia bacterium]|nr:DUF3137 domain-containing protein [Verrucomicrobiota bacterium]